MEFTTIVLVQIAIFYCLATLLPTSRSNSTLKISAIGVLIILSMSWYFMPDRMSKIGIGAWIVLVLITMSLMQRLESLVNSSQYVAASRLAKWLRWLMPSDGMWDYHYLLDIIALAQTGQIEAAQELFEQRLSGKLPRGELTKGLTALASLQRLQSGAVSAHSLVELLEACRTRLPAPTVAKLDKPVCLLGPTMYACNSNSKCKGCKVAPTSFDREF